MLCTNCKSKEAIFHYKQIIGGRKTEQHLCPSCAQSLGYIGQGDSIFDVASILNDFISVPKVNNLSKKPIGCQSCNTTYDEFRRTGFLGCEKCYESFASIIESSLSQIQPSTIHKGSLGGEDGEKIRKQNELTELKDNLKKAVIEERYEDAVVLRDKIKELEERENG